MTAQLAIFYILVILIFVLGGLKYRHMNLEHEYRIELIDKAKTGVNSVAPDCLIQNHQPKKVNNGNANRS